MLLFLQTVRAVFLDVIADFFYFPIWWYTRGLWRQLRGSAGSLAKRQRDLAIDVWLKNLLTPMYGQYDIGGRVISFFIRLLQIVGRSVVLIIWIALLIVGLIAWILIPVVVVYFIWLEL